MESTHQIQDNTQTNTNNFWIANNPIIQAQATWIADPGTRTACYKGCCIPKKVRKSEYPGGLSKYEKTFTFWFFT